MKTTALAALLALAALSGCRTTQAEDYSDAALKARLETLLRGRPDLDMRYVVIDVHSSAATVSGLVPTIEQKREIDRIVRRTRGIETVLNNLLVQD